MTAVRFVSASLVAISLVTGPAAGTPNAECGWTEGFGSVGLSGSAEATAVWDDGTGEALYAGGSMITADGEDVRFIARWDGDSWSPLTGSFGTGLDHWVWDLEVFDDGSGEALYVAGQFRHAGGLPADSIARWDGTEWSALPEGGPAFITALEVFDDGSGPVLVAAGIVEVAAWDGTSWTRLGSLRVFGNPQGAAMKAWDDGGGSALYLGGAFQEVDGVDAPFLARWDGSAWSAVHAPGGFGPDDGVSSLEVFDDGTGPALYVGGRFDHVDGIEAGGIARWDGSTWSAVAEPAFGEINTMTVYDDGSGQALWLGGSFSGLGGVLANGIARWDGETVSEPAAGGLEGRVQALIPWNDGTGDALYVFGSLTQAGEIAIGNVARLDGGGWRRLGTGSGDGMNAYVSELAVYDDGSGPSVYAAGEFTLAGASEIFHVARWSGTRWKPLGGVRLGGEVGALEVYDDGRKPALYVGGTSLTLGGEPVSSLLRWDGLAWSEVDPANPLLQYIRSTPYPGEVFSLQVFDDGTGPALYAGGYFSHVGEQEVDHLARWDGSSWSGLGGGMENSNGVGALRVWDDGTGPALYAGGAFGAAGGVETRLGIARWDGSSWSSLDDAGGLDVRGSVRALEVFDDGTGSALYAGGSFSSHAPPYFRHIARWDGSNWEPLGSVLEAGVAGVVFALEVFDDGAGPALYVGGSFREANGIEVNDIARWDGADWTPLPGPLFPGLAGVTYALAADPHRPALWVGGALALAGGVPSNNVATWSCGALEEPILHLGFVPLL